MKHKLKLFLTLVVLISSDFLLVAQTDEPCGTAPMDSATFVSQPWYGNNQFLLKLLDSLGYTKGDRRTFNNFPIEGGFDEGAKYWIPIKAWVYRENDGTGGYTEEEVEKRIRELNDIFSGRRNNYGGHPHSTLQFYLGCDIEYINNSDMAINTASSNLDYVWDKNFEAGMLNIHFVISHHLWAGIARLPHQNSYKNFICAMVRNVSTTTLAHEIGHCLGLNHTHYTRELYVKENGNSDKCFQESVSRNRLQETWCDNADSFNCSVNGDAICDTEADPLLSHRPNMVNNMHGDWKYVGGGKDNWGDAWQPNVFNIMSYSVREIREYFSPMQKAVMLYWALGIPDGPYSKLNIVKQFVDIYEPDNTLANASEITINSRQLRGFHITKSGNVNNPNEKLCDHDWVRFSVTQDNFIVNILTESFNGQFDVNTEIFLYSNNGSTLIASNDNKLNGGLYSELKKISLDKGDYWIKVENKGNTAGQYQLVLIDSEYIWPEVRFNVFPNPANRELFVSGAENYDFVIYNLLGEKVLSGRIEDEKHLIHIESLSTGMYIMQVKTNSQAHNVKFVVVRD